MAVAPFGLGERRGVSKYHPKISVELLISGPCAAAMLADPRPLAWSPAEEDCCVSLVNTHLVHCRLGSCISHFDRCCTRQRAVDEGMQRQVSGRARRRHGGRHVLASFSQGQLWGERLRTGHARAHDRAGDDTVGGDTINASRKGSLSQRRLTKILKGIGGTGAAAHLSRSVQCQQGQQWQWRHALDRKGWRLLQRVQSAAEGLSAAACAFSAEPCRSSRAVRQEGRRQRALPRARASNRRRGLGRGATPSD